MEKVHIYGAVHVLIVIGHSWDLHLSGKVLEKFIYISSSIWTSNCSDYAYKRMFDGRLEAGKWVVGFVVVVRESWEMVRQAQ